MTTMQTGDQISSAVDRFFSSSEDPISSAVERYFSRDLGGVSRALGSGAMNTAAGAVEGSSIVGSHLAPAARDAASGYAGLVAPGAADRIGGPLEALGGGRIAGRYAEPVSLSGGPIPTPSAQVQAIGGQVPPEVAQAIAEQEATGRSMQGAIIGAGLDAGQAIRDAGPEYERSSGFRGILEDVAGAVPQLIGAAGATAAGAAVGGPAGAIGAGAGFMALTDAGNQTSEIYQRLIADGVPEDEAASRATQAGAMYGAASGVLESAGLGTVLKGTKLLGRLGKASEKAATRGRRVAGAAGRVGESAFVEGGTEALQGIVGEAAQAWAREDWGEFKTSWYDLDVRGREALVGALLGATVRGGVEALDPSNYRSAKEMLAAIETEAVEVGTAEPQATQPQSPATGIEETATPAGVDQPSPQPTPVRIVLKDAPVAPVPDSRLADGTAMFKDKAKADAYAAFKNERLTPEDSPVRVLEPLQGAAEPVWAVVPDTRLDEARARGERQTAEVTEFARGAVRTRPTSAAESAPEAQILEQPASPASAPVAPLGSAGAVAASTREAGRNQPPDRSGSGTASDSVRPQPETAMPVPRGAIAQPSAVQSPAPAQSAAVPTEAPGRASATGTVAASPANTPPEPARTATPSPQSDSQASQPPVPKDTPERHKFSSTQVDLPSPIARKVQRVGRKLIPDDALAGEGRETEPHITVKYGLHTEDAAEVQRAVAGFGPIRVTLGETSTFPPSESSDGAEVVKVDVEGEDIRRLNAAIAEALDTTDTHPTYIPHVTLAYVREGMGEKFAGDSSLKGTTLEISEITFSDRDGGKHLVDLTGSASQDTNLGRKSSADKPVSVRPDSDARPTADMTRAQLLTEAESLGVDAGPKSKPALAKRVEAARARSLSVGDRIPWKNSPDPNEVVRDIEIVELTPTFAKVRWVGGEETQRIPREAIEQRRSAQSESLPPMPGGGRTIPVNEMDRPALLAEAERLGVAEGPKSAPALRKRIREAREGQESTPQPEAPEAPVAERADLPDPADMTGPALRKEMIAFGERPTTGDKGVLAERVRVLRERAETEKKGASGTQRMLDFADKMEADARAANAKMNIPRGRGTGATLPPAYYANLVKIGAAKIIRGVAKFADFSAQMLKEEGDWIEPSLRDIYRDSLDLAGDMETSKTAPTTEQITERVNARREREAGATSARAADTASDRADMGLDALDSPARRSWQEALDKARERGIPEGALSLAAQVNTDPRALSDIETAGLVQRAAELKKQHKRVMGQIGNADRATSKTLSAESSRIEAEFDVLTEALRKSGTEKGRALASQKLALDQDFSLIAVKARAKAAKGESLTERQAKLIENLVRRLEQADERATNAEARAKQATAEQAVKTHRKASKRPPKVRAVEFDAKLARARELLKMGCR